MFGYRSLSGGDRMETKQHRRIVRTRSDGEMGIKRETRVNFKLRDDLNNCIVHNSNGNGSYWLVDHMNYCNSFHRLFAVQINEAGGSSCTCSIDFVIIVLLPTRKKKKKPQLSTMDV